MFKLLKFASTTLFTVQASLPPQTVTSAIVPLLNHEGSMWKFGVKCMVIKCQAGQLRV
jgi:hypothetical protein